MKKRTFTLALVVLFALTLIPIVAVADTNLIDLAAPAGVDAPDSHWGWSSRDGIDTLPKNMRGIEGIIIEFDHEPGEVEFVVQSPVNWWDHPHSSVVDGTTLEINFSEFTPDWEKHSKQYEVHLVFGNWVEDLTPANIVSAKLIGTDMGAPQFAPGDVDPVLAAPTVDDFGGHDHWGWSMEIGSLPWNMSEITGIVIEFDFEPGQVEFVIQSPAPGTGWWDHPGATAFEGNTLTIDFADFTADWAAHQEQSDMHLVFGSWDESVSPSNVVSAHLVGTVADGIPDPDSGPVIEEPDEGTIPFDMGLGGMIWGDQENQLGWNGDTRAIAEQAPFAGAGGLSARLLVEAKYFVVYVDHAPDDEIAEMLKLTIFGNANGWSWEGGTMEAPTVQIYDTFVPGAIAFPLGGHPYVAAIQGAGEDELDNRNFGISFEYEGGIANLGITSVMLLADLPEAPPAHEDAPPPAHEDAPATPAPAAPTSEGGLPTWALISIIGGGVAIVAVIIAVVVKKKK